MNETREQATVRMVNDPTSWPRLTLPLKKSGNGSFEDLKIALLYASLDEPYRYFISRGANLFMPELGSELEPITPGQVLAEGWEVD